MSESAKLSGDCTTDRMRQKKMLARKNSETKPFSCRYYHDGAWWALTVHAYDWNDAEVRCKKMGINLDGEFVAMVPVNVGFLAKAACLIRNLFSRVQ